MQVAFRPHTAHSEPDESQVARQKKPLLNDKGEKYGRFVGLFRAEGITRRAHSQNWWVDWVAAAVYGKSET